MDNNNLSQIYDDLKSDLSRPEKTPNLINVGSMQNSPGAELWRRKAVDERNKLTDACCKHILLDIYCKVLPLDAGYVDGHTGQMKSDIDSMLNQKGKTATQYLTSGYGETKAPLLEFILRSTDNIGKKFMKEADETLKDAHENGIDIPPPKSDPESEQTEEQLVDIKKDTEYENFIDTLKDKTIKKIVNDVSKIITDKKDEKDMTFDTTPIADTQVATESTISVAVNYINQKMWKENVSLTPELKDEMMGLAIRESTLNIIDLTFKQPRSEFKEFASNIRFGKGVLINENVIPYFVESAQRLEPLFKETDGGKYDISNYEKVDNDGKKTPMNDSEAKKVLDAEGYKAFQAKGLKH